MNQLKHRGRLSVRIALSAVAGFALTLTALRQATSLWWLATLLATTGLLLWATLGAIVLRGPNRISWLGAALFGWVLFAMIHPNRIFPDFRPSMYAILQSFGEAVHAYPPDAIVDPNDKFEVQERIYSENHKQTMRTDSLRANFISILMMLINLAFAIVRGWAGRSFAARIESAVPASPQPVYTNGVKEAT